MSMVRPIPKMNTQAVPEFGTGVRDSLPVIVGIVPFGLACGIMGVTVGLTPLETVLMSALVFAGAAQFVAITMLGIGPAGWGMIVLTTLLINLRHLLMGFASPVHDPPVHALVAVLGALYLPGKWYIIIACLAASVAGGLLEGKKDAQ